MRHLYVAGLSCLALALLSAAPPVAAQPAAPLAEELVERLLATRGPLDLLEPHVAPACVIATTRCGETRSGILDVTDCALDDGTPVDFWEFSGKAGDRVTIELASNDFDTTLFLLDPSPTVVAFDDDSGPGSNSRLEHVLTVNGPWTIAVAPFSIDFGTYAFSLECEGAGCQEGPQTLCLSNDRFRVEVDFRTPQGTSGAGRAEPLTADTGYFWFFEKDNVEMVVKVLNACGFANRFWVFAGGLTNVEVDMRVTDTETGQFRDYTNPLRTPFQPLQDTNAFATCP